MLFSVLCSVLEFSTRNRFYGLPNFHIVLINNRKNFHVVVKFSNGDPLVNRLQFKSYPR